MKKYEYDKSPLIIPITPIEIRKTNIAYEAKFPSWNKQMSWSDYEKLIVDTPKETVIISETICLSSEDFIYFKDHLLEDQKWLSGKGGFTNSDPKHNNNRLRVCVYVGGPNAGTSVDHNFGILVDPSGFDYARYCGKLQ